MEEDGVEWYGRDGRKDPLFGIFKIGWKGMEPNGIHSIICHPFSPFLFHPNWVEWDGIKKVGFFYTYFFLTLPPSTCGRWGSWKTIHLFSSQLLQTFERWVLLSQWCVFLDCICMVVVCVRGVASVLPLGRMSLWFFDSVLWCEVFYCLVFATV